MFAAGMSTFMGLYFVQGLLPEFSTAFGASPAASALAVSVTTGAVAFAIIPASVLSERVGRVPVMTASALSSGVVGVALCWAPTFELLLAGRTLQGLLLAGVPATAMAYLAEESDPGTLGRAMGRYVAGTTLGGLAGRLLPTVALDATGWRTALLVGAGTSLVFAVVFWRTVPPSRRFTPRSIHPRTVAAALARHLRDRGMFALFGVGFALMGGFVTAYNYLGYRLLAPPFSLPPSAVGFVFVLYLAGTVSSARAGALSDRIGRPRALAASIVLMAAGLALTLPDSLPFVLAGVFVFTGGFFGAHAVASAWVGARARRDRGEAAALYLFGYYLGSSVVGACGGFAYAAAGWPGVAGYVAAFALLGLGLAGAAARAAPRMSG